MSAPRSFLALRSKDSKALAMFKASIAADQKLFDFGSSGQWAVTASLYLMLVVLLTGCAGIVRKSTPEVWYYNDAVPVGFPASIRSIADTQEAFEARAASVLPRVRAAAGDGPVNILALSGGGAGGAFGAGALVGWTRRGTRPEFQIVTGVSAGALIAPFAFLGPAWDGQLTEAFSGDLTQHLLQSQWPGALFGTSVYRGGPLVALVDRYVTDELLRAVALEAAKGRLLAVATTDLDKEETVIWNLGEIAAQGGEPARRLFRDVVVASASIPGAFPPVIIRVEDSGAIFDEMHVDGATTASLFVAPEIAGYLATPLLQLKGANLYVIVNGQLGTVAQTTPARTLKIFQRGLAAAFRSNARADLAVVSAFAQHHGMNVRVTDIPEEYPYGGPLDLDRSKMRGLFDFGSRCAVEERLWADPLEVVARAERAHFRALPGLAQCPAMTPTRDPAVQASNVTRPESARESAANGDADP
jgi:hypothetical protein